MSDYQDQLTEKRRAALWAQIDERNLQLAMLRKRPTVADRAPSRTGGTLWLIATLICLTLAGAAFGASLALLWHDGYPVQEGVKPGTLIDENILYWEPAPSNWPAKKPITK